MKILSFVAATMLLGMPAHAQDKVSEVDKIFSWVTPGMPGCTVAVSHRGKVVANRAYGLADLDRNLPLRTDSILDAGSVVKQFVAASVLLLVQDKRLSLSEDVRQYVPELPDYGHKITLDHLMTHTSGIRDWTGLGPLTGRKVDALTLTLRQRGLNFVPGDEWFYSNSGYVLLKEVVSRTSRMSFGDFTRKRLFEPLGMKSTVYALDGAAIKNLALAYERAGMGWKLDVHVGNARGGGGALFTTASDLLTWNDALSSGKLGKFVTGKLQEPARLNNGRTLGYARGLFLDTNRGSRVIWHSGGAAGYGSFLVRFPEQALSIATMCNAGDTATEGTYARRISELFVPASTGPGADANLPAASAGGPDVEGIEVKSKAGLFFGEADGQPLRLGVDNGRLRIVGGPILDAVTKDHFRNPRGSLRFMSADEFQLRFVAPDLVELESMEGRTKRYRRAQPYTPSASDLEAFAGRYGNEETRAVFEVAPGAGGLTFRVSWNESQAFDFRPVDRDTFQLGGMFVRFRRDGAGKAIALDYSNPLVRNVEFTRERNRPGGH